jgi:tetratricopeptide (TPR) repeat protein
MPSVESNQISQSKSSASNSPARRFPGKFVLLLLGIFLLAGSLFYWFDPLSWRTRSTSESHWQQAQRALEDRDYVLAKDHLEQCLEIAPLCAEFQFMMARTCRRLDDPSGWSDHLHKAAVLSWPQNQIQLELRLKEAQTGNTGRMESVLVDDLDSRDPNLPIIFEALIKGYLENDRYRDAHRMADAWVRDHPGDWQARLYRGRAYQQGIHFEEAIADYQYVLKVKPDHRQAQLWLAETFASDRQYGPALEYFQAFVHSHPNASESPGALYALADCQYSLGQVDAARDTLDNLLAKNKGNTAALLLRAQLEQTESAEKALPWLLQAEVATPNNIQVLNNLILALRALRRNDEADKYDRRRQERDPKEKALVKLKMRILSEPDNADLRYQIALAYLDLGDEDESAHWFQTVLWLDPDHRPTFQALADYWQRKGNLTRANHYRSLGDGKTPPVQLGKNSSGK